MEPESAIYAAVNKTTKNGESTPLLSVKKFFILVVA